MFNFDWVFDRSLSTSVIQVLSGPKLPKKPCIMWENLSKALLRELWFDHNQHIFLDRARPRAEIMRVVDTNAAAWCSLKMEFVNYSIQDICLNWEAFLTIPP